MFHQRNTSLRGDGSPFNLTSQASPSVQSRRIAGVFTPQRKQRQQLNRSMLQSTQVLEETSHFRVEKYGLPLPVLITEALTYADGTTCISVNIEESGWAWLVGGRKLFVWRYKHAQPGRNILCKELTLPPSDLAHSANRVCIIPTTSDGQMASCVAVSPEGVVRYWGNIAYEASYQEISAELKGEECDCVINMAPYGCLLATTTSSLVMIAVTPGQNVVSFRPLKSTQGMFSGISRRMSSFIFGGGQGQATGVPLQSVIAGVHEEDERPFYVLSGTHLNKWVVGDYNMERFMYQIDADRLFRESLAKQVWNKDAIQMTQLTTWLIDMQQTNDGVVLLGAGIDHESQPVVVHFGLATIDTECSGTPSKLEAFKVLDLVEQYQEEREAEIQSYRLVLPQDRQQSVYLYNDVTVVMDTGSGESCDKIPAPGGRLLGAGICEQTAVFFSISQGLLSISSTHKQDVSILDEGDQEMLVNADKTQMNMTVNQTQIAEMGASEDKSERLKAAFLSACSGRLKEAEEIIEDLFPASLDVAGNQSSEIDRLVTGLSQNLIDDFPTSDPRWAESGKHDAGHFSAGSLIINQQLRDKQKAHMYIINFLKKLNLWDRLRTVKVGDNLMATKLLLCQHAEQLAAAIVLREIHAEDNTVIDPAIHKVLVARGGPSMPGLSPHDLFYREVSQIQSIFEALMSYERDIMSGNTSPADVVSTILKVNPVFEGMIHDALQLRLQKDDMFRLGAELEQVPEYIPWTSQGGPTGIRTLLHQQFQLTLECAVPEARELDTRDQLFQQLLGLADNILNGYTSQLASLENNQALAEYTAQLSEKYLQERHNLIAPFLENKQYDLAASIAEKYCDFEMLVQICEQTENQSRIERYQEMFADKGFADFLFSWYMKEGKPGRLLSLPTPHQTQLQNFLDQDDFGYLKWLHDIECKNFKSAHETLLDLGRNEEKYLGKKKTLLSLSKLSALAYGIDGDDQLQSNVRDIDEEQELIIHQELLPADLLQCMNIDPEYMKVLTPVELIQLYISNDNVGATECDFMKALDLLQFINADDPAVDYEAIRSAIWCQAIMRDRNCWTHTPTGDPLASVRDTIFCKTISLAANADQSPQEFLPALRTLMECEILEPLSSNKQTQYLLGAVYETAGVN